MPLGMEVGLSPGNFVLDGGRIPPPIVVPRLLWPNGCMDQDVLDGDPVHLPYI